MFPSTAIHLCQVHGHLVAHVEKTRDPERIFDLSPTALKDRQTWHARVGQSTIQHQASIGNPDGHSKLTEEPIERPLPCLASGQTRVT